MTRTTCFALLLLFTLAACGVDDSRHKGSLAWDAGQGVLEITGSGEFTLELNNNGAASVLIHRPEDSSPATFELGDSIRVRSKGPQTWRFSISNSKKAHLDYVFKGDEGTHIDARIE